MSGPLISLVGGGQSPPPAGFVRVSRSGPDPGGQVGCMFVLAGLLLTIGVGIVAAFVINPAGKGDMWVMPLVGGAFALVGAVLLYGGLRGARGLKIPTPEMFLGRALPLQAGTVTSVWFRQAGPVNIESLTLEVLCERVYRRRVKPNSSSTVEDRERLWEQTLLAVTNERVAAGGVLEREATLDLPADALASGPAQPDGEITWKFEVRAETGLLSATWHPFDLAVRRDEAPSSR